MRIYLTKKPPFISFFGFIFVGMDVYMTGKSSKKGKITLCLAVFFFLCTIPLHAYYYGKNKIQPEKIEWSVYESQHFDVHFVKGNDEFGQLTLLMAENAYYQLNEFFQQPLKNRIPLIVYSSKQDFQSTNIIYPLLTEGIGGFTETLRNRVALPFDGSYKKFEEVLVHELTHAYINDINNELFRNSFLRQNNIPFWLAEGLPEYLSIAGTDNYNNMFVKDMVINDQLIDIEYLGGYFAYRLGEAILVWIDATWGRDKVIEFFYNIRIQSDLQKATKATFGFDFRQLQDRFHVALKRQHNSLLNEFQTPWEIGQQRLTEGRKSQEIQNVFPRLSKDGNEFVYYSSNKGRTVIRSGSPLKLFKDTIVLTGERTGDFEEFHFQRNNLAYFPDNRQIAFVSKTSFGDVIYFYDIKKEKVTQKLHFTEFDAIYEIDISPDGTLLAFTAQKQNRCDIYLYDITIGQIKQLTDDQYLNYTPNFSPDGSKIAFVRESETGQQSEGPYIFTLMAKNIWYFDINTRQMYQVTDDLYDNYYPIWASDSQIMFITEKNQIANIDIIDMAEQNRATVTKLLTGLHSFDFHPQNKSLIFSVYHENAWDIFTITSPLENLDFYPYPIANIPKPLQDSFHDFFSTSSFQLYGRPPEPVTEPDSIYAQPKHNIRGKKDYTARDFLDENRGFHLDTRPDSTHFTIPLLRDYTPRFGINMLWGGMAYSPGYGAIGMLQISLSDLMGDHGIGMSVEFNGQMKDSNMVASYMYLPYRIDIGVALFNYYDSLVYYIPDLDVPFMYDEYRRRQTGGIFLLQYPLSRFFRLDFQNSLYKYSIERHLWYNGSTEANDITIQQRDPVHIYMPQLGFVFDNALYGSTGPMSGNKLTTFIRSSVSSPEYTFTTLYSDWRGYLPLSQRFSIATRAIYGISEGKNPEQFNLWGFNGVRGFSEDYVYGRKKALASIELRYPLISRLDMAFPIPLSINNLRGSIFVDAGSVWDIDKNFIGAIDGTLNDIKFGYGFGPRLNLGIFILKFDIAWASDWSQTSKPTYFITINEDF